MERSTDRVTEYAYGKLNLGLDVTGKREDGYHLVRMVMQTVDVCDTLVIERIPGEREGVILNKLHIPAGGLSEDEDNLALKAARRMQECFSINEAVDITLEKRIPVSAGMAGGSADAAAVLRAMRKLFLPELSFEELEKIAVSIGADVPYCLYGGTVLAEGIGEKLTFLRPAPDMDLIICKPPVDVPTPLVYRLYDAEDKPLHPDIDAMVRAVENRDKDGVIRCFGNALESVTSAMHPEVSRLESFFSAHGAVRAMMTGSGPTVFAVFESAAGAEKCLEALKGHPEFSRWESFGCGFRHMRES